MLKNAILDAKIDEDFANFLDYLTLFWQGTPRGRQPAWSSPSTQTARSRRPRSGASSSAPRAGRADGWATTPSLFPGLVLGWINADFGIQIRILQHFSRSPRKSSFLKQICKNSAKILRILQNLWIFKNFRKSAKYCKMLQNLAEFFAAFCKIL